MVDSVTVAARRRIATAKKSGRSANVATLLPRSVRLADRCRAQAESDLRPHGATQLGNAATVAQMPAAEKQGGHHGC